MSYPDTQTNQLVIYVDMDHVLCDYETGYELHAAKYPQLEFPQSQPGMYVDLEPLPDAVETYRWLDSHPRTKVYILSAPSVMNPHCYSEKRIWVERYLGLSVAENLILSSHKGLNRGDYLIDDNLSGKGQEYFSGKIIHFGSAQFPDWKSVREYFAPRL